MEKTTLSAKEALLLQHLGDARDGLLIFTLYRRLRLGPADLHRLLKRVEKRGLIRQDGDRLELTGEGRKALITSGKQELMFRKRPWRDIPAVLREPVGRVNAPYIPSLSRLDKNSFDLDSPEED